MPDEGRSDFRSRFSLVVWPGYLKFDWLMGVVEVGEWTVSSRTEVKCYQFIWSFRERCWFESTMRESHRVPKKRSEHKHLLTVTKTGHGSLGRPRKPRSAPERIVFQTPDDRVELLFRSSGVWGTESFTAASTDWSDVSLNRDKLEWVCLRSKLWMQPVTEWVFSTHTRTQTHTLTHPFSSHSRTFRHMYKHTTSHLWHKNQHETRPVWRGLLSVTQQPLLWWVRLIDGGSTCWPLVRRQDPCSVSTTLKSSGHISWSQIKKVKSDLWVNLCPTCDQETEQISAGSVTIFLRSYASSDKWTRECETATETNLNLTTTVVKTMSFNQHKRRILRQETFHSVQQTTETPCLQRIMGTRNVSSRDSHRQTEDQIGQNPPEAPPTFRKWHHYTYITAQQRAFSLLHLQSPSLFLSDRSRISTTGSFHRDAKLSVIVRSRPTLSADTGLSQIF